MICFYHNADNDGFCSAAIVKRAYPDCALHGVNYGHKVPWDVVNNHTEVIVVDFAFTPEEMSRLNAGSNLVWIDHHKTAIELVSSSIRGVREIGRAACELTWNYYFPFKPMPLGVHLLGRYDVWDHSNYDAVYFEEGIQQYDVNPNSSIWASILADSMTFTNEVIKAGKSIVAYNTNKDIRKNVTLTFDAKLGNLTVVAANNLCNSKFFESSYDSNYHDAMCAFYLGKKGGWKYSLYSTTIDCSVIAQQYGGGGHAGAAGFVNKDYLLRRLDA